VGRNGSKSVDSCHELIKARDFVFTRNAPRGPVCHEQPNVRWAHLVYFDDLALCFYHHGPLDADSWAVPLRAVGWLEHPHEVPVGSVPAGFASRLAELVVQTETTFQQYTFRGVHECSHCLAAGGAARAVGWSQENLIIPGDGEVFAAPGGIVHYVEDHGYCPPARFVAAVMACPDCDSPEYLQALRRANANREIPVETNEQDSLRWKAKFRATATFKEALGVPLKQATRTQVVAAARRAWPDESFPDDASSLQLGPVRVTFDAAGRVSDISD
jgi:hypothetical protein